MKANWSYVKIDFLIQKDVIHPIEVKAEENVKSRSLRTVYENNPKVMPWRFSMSGYRKQEWMTNIPLYALADWVKRDESENRLDAFSIARY